MAEAPGDRDEGLPSSLQEYFYVWCADLIAPLTGGQQQQLLDAIMLGHWGGPWPRRRQIQRLVEQAAGLITSDAIVGEITALYGHSVDKMLEHLDDPDYPASRENLIQQLGRHPYTDELIPKVDAALKAGAVAPSEHQDICDRALRAPLLPALVPAPLQFPDLPRDYPESFDECRRRYPDSEAESPDARRE